MTNAGWEDEAAGLLHLPYEAPYALERVHKHMPEVVRYGIDGKLIDFGRREEVTVHQLVDELLELIDDVSDELGIRRETEYVRTILAEGTSADRQIATYKRTGDLKAVVDQVIRETKAG